ncbi:RNA-directed RNA polymerase L [Acrasis kona]|uniref:RNA-directed RNA polymerase L n=1 Tax=Acrasis kona TaxID=1008807 RepID=A0AAW2YW94_9EUKA
MIDCATNRYNQEKQQKMMKSASSMSPVVEEITVENEPDYMNAVFDSEPNFFEKVIGCMCLTRYQLCKNEKPQNKEQQHLMENLMD